MFDTTQAQTVTQIGEVSVYLAEEQRLLRDAYRAFLVPHPGLEVLGISEDTTGEALIVATAALKPDVLVLGIKVLQPDTVERLQALRRHCPNLAIVLLSAVYGFKGIKALRGFSQGASIGSAYLLKHTIDTVEQLTQVIRAVAQGRIIVDPAVMEALLDAADPRATVLKELSLRELEVLSWMAKGYNDDAIADVLCLETKAVERHVNSIYAKLGPCPSSKEPRMHITMQYLRATGLLPPSPASVI